MGGEDTWESFMIERNQIFNFVKNFSIQGVVLLSADRHYAGIVKIVDGM